MTKSICEQTGCCVFTGFTVFLAATIYCVVVLVLFIPATYINFDYMNCKDDNKVLFRDCIREFESGVCSSFYLKDKDICHDAISECTKTMINDCSTKKARNDFINDSVNVIMTYTLQGGVIMIIFDMVVVSPILLCLYAHTTKCGTIDIERTEASVRPM